MGTELEAPAGGDAADSRASGEQSQIALLASYDQRSGQLAVTPVAAGGAEQKSLELWLVEGEQPPVSLGVLPQTGQGEIAVPEALRGRLAEGVVLAVSLEPFWRFADRQGDRSGAGRGSRSSLIS